MAVPVRTISDFNERVAPEGQARESLWVKRVLLCCLLIAGALFPAALAHRAIYVDEAWLGQQVYSLITRGAVYSDYFRDQPPLDGRIVLYHSLTIWAGAIAAKIGGWGLYSLRVVSSVAGLLVLTVLWYGPRTPASRNHAVLATLLLAASPVFYHGMMTYRPETVVTAFGFIAFLCLERGFAGNRSYLYVLGGCCAGLAGASHAIGFSAAVAGLVTLAVHRKFRAALLFAAGALVGLVPYGIEFAANPELFLTQALRNDLLQARPGDHWWQPLLGVLSEHKRWFRNADVIGLSALFVVALPLHRKDGLRRESLRWYFMAALAILLAVAPVPKLARYVLPLSPFMALTIADALLTPRAARHQTGLYRTVVVLAAAHVLFGIGLLAKEVLADRNDQMHTNRRLAVAMNAPALVMAPFDFVFVEQSHFTIQGYGGARKHAQKDTTAATLENYADSLGVQYLILSPEELRVWKLDSHNPATSFTRYDSLLYLPDQQRWCLERRGL